MADSIRDALMGAIGNNEDSAPVTTEVVEPQKAVEVTPPTSGSNDVKPTDDRESSAAPTSTPAKAEGGVTPQPASAAGAEPDTPAPASWKPEAKTLWGQIPGTARAEIARRETETARALSHSAESRKFHQQFEQIVAPHKELFEKYQIPPIAAVKDMMTWRATLEHGSIEEKAALIGNMVRNFKIDIAKLDDYLVSSPQNSAPQAPQFDPTAVPALQPLFAIAERIQQAQKEQIEATVDEIASDPLFEELREDTADILEWASNRGREMTVKQAFEQAKALNGHAPAPAPISASQAGAALAAARKAGGAIAGAPKAISTGKPDSIRDLISAQLG